ncbi:hypothetical protein GCM10023089_20310 [Quisquiliibacterium transsilvanicum]
MVCAAAGRAAANATAASAVRKIFFMGRIRQEGWEGAMMPANKAGWNEFLLLSICLSAICTVRRTARVAAQAAARLSAYCLV